MEQENLEQFLHDAGDFCDELRRVLVRMEREPADRDLVHRAFRVVHSLKSEAQLLEADEVAAVAEEIEGILTQIRQGALELGTESLDVLNPMAETLDGMLAELSAGVPRKQSATVHASAGVGAPAFEDPPPADRPTRHAASGLGGEGGVSSSRLTTSLPLFTDFETQLVVEAVGRGERFYRMTCRTEDSAPLKYPKAYLVVNNLELVTNVIRSVPSLDTREDEAFREFTVYFTAGIGEGELREAVDVDQVDVVELSELPFRPPEEADEATPPVRSFPSARRGPSSVRVENGRMDEVTHKLVDLRTAASRLVAGGTAAELPDEIRRELAGLSETVRELQRLVNETRQVPLADEFRHLPWLMRDLSTQLGKEARLVTIGAELRVDRRLAAMLSDPLVHLVRNAVDHGIEDPRERAALGKPREGTVVVAAIEREDELLLQVGDDGGGMSLSDITMRAGELGLTTRTTETTHAEGGARDLLELLIQPGFSMRNEATAVSGRGVGLDVTYQKVHGALGGTLRLQTRKGEGSLFTISIPGATSMMSLLMVRSGRYTVGIALRSVASVREVGSGTFRLGDDGLLFSDHVPLYAAEGRLTPADVGGSTYQVVTLGTGDGRIAFMSDELLFERDLPERSLNLGDPVGPLLRKVSIGAVTADFLFLDTGLL